jgi:hypothetical protein
MNLEATPTPLTRAPLWQRLFRSLSLAGLALALTVLTVLLVLGCLPMLVEALEQESSTGGKYTKGIVSLALLLFILLPLGLLAVFERKRWITWKFLLVAWAAVLPVLGWLAWDEPAIHHPLPVEEFSPAFPGAEESYAVLMRYGKREPGEEARAFANVKMQAVWGGTATSPRDPAKWREWVVDNRAAIEADWAALAPQRRWLAELAAFERIGDLTQSSIDADIPTFQVWRLLSQRTCGIATLQAIDGRRDEAIATLLPMLMTGRKLQVSSRTLVRSMIAVVVERMCLETAGVILDLGPVSPDTRDRLAAALGAENGPALARRLILIEYVHFAPVFSNLKLGDALGLGLNESKLRQVVRAPLNWLSGLLINPNATTNIYGRNVFDLANLAEARELGKFSVRSRDFGDSLLRRPGMKNLGGRLVLNMAVPAYDKVLESHWKTVDLRIALRERLAAAGGG